MNIYESLILEITKGTISIFVALVVLFVTWRVGQKVIWNWDGLKKRQELDIQREHEFQQFFGQFKEISKLWREVVNKEAKCKIQPNANSEWELLSKACMLEGKCETFLVRIATERKLEPEEQKNLGLFRQAIQQLRESIRARKDVASNDRGPDNDFLITKMTTVMYMLSKRHPQWLENQWPQKLSDLFVWSEVSTGWQPQTTILSPDQIGSNLAGILSVNKSNYNAAIASLPEKEV